MELATIAALVGIVAGLATIASHIHKHIQPQDVALNDEFAVVALYATRTETDQPWVQIAPLLWG